ncbi:Nn.00g091060.m01.CDS01 [Neocucurbitaria sp. VM-36]
MPSNPTVELWTLYALGVSFTILRTYARLVAVGLRELRPDDYLIWLAILIYTAQCSLGHNLGVLAHGLANNGITDAQRSALSHDDPEYAWRVIGSKIQVAGWTTAACLLWTLKLCMTFFYLRLTTGLQLYQKRIHIAMVLIAITFIVVIMTIYLSCRPFHRYWQINPDPGNICQAAISKPILWVSFVSNVSTDVYLFLIPIPMLWRSSLKLLKKIAATLVLSAGLLIIVCATLKSIYVIVDPVNGGQLAAAWGTRETFIAVVTTNLPMIFPLFKTWLAPFLPSNLRSSSNNNKAYKSPGSGFVTIGGGGGASSRSRQGPHSSSHITANMTFDNESQEHIVKGNGDVKLQHVHNNIVVSKQVSVTTEDYNSERSAESVQRV